MIKKLDNKGLSLVELVIAIAMSTIVVGAAAMFLYNAERSYRTAQYSVNLQMEAQLVMEQMSNWVLESNSMRVYTVNGNKVLVLYYIPTRIHNTSATTTSVSYVMPTAKRDIIYQNINDKKIYMNSATASDPSGYINELKEASPTALITQISTLQNEAYDSSSTSTYCICEYGETFDVKVESFDSTNGTVYSVGVDIGLHEGISKQSQDYTVSNVYSLRNLAYISE